MEIVSRHLTTLKVIVDFAGMLDFGTVAIGRRRFAPVSGGTFAGERLRGEVLPGGGDWVINRPDGAMLVDVRLPLRTHDGATIALSYHGAMLATPEAMARFNRGGSLSPGEYRLKTIARFETGDDRYAWLNDLTVIGISGPTTADRQYALHEII